MICDGIGSRKGKVVNDKGNIQWMFPVNSECGKDRHGSSADSYVFMLIKYCAVKIFIEQRHGSI